MDPGPLEDIRLSRCKRAVHLRKGPWLPLTKPSKPYSHSSPSNSHFKPCILSGSALCFQPRFCPNNRYFQTRKWHQMPYQIMSSGTNNHCRDEPISETKAEWGLKCCFYTPHFLTQGVWIVKKSSLLPLLPPSFTSLAWFGCCTSFHQLYNLETWGLFQGNHRNLRCFNLIRSLRKKQNTQVRV